MPYRYRDYAGFSLIELIVTILLVGILAAIAVPRLNLEAFREQGFFQQSLAAIRTAQKQAITSGCHVRVEIDSATCRLFWNGQPAGQGCPADGTAISNPASGREDFCASSEPSGPVNAVFSFDNIGRPGGAQTINIGGRTIRVEAETGYAHEI